MSKTANFFVSIIISLRVFFSMRYLSLISLIKINKRRHSLLNTEILEVTEGNRFIFSIYLYTEGFRLISKYYKETSIEQLENGHNINVKLDYRFKKAMKEQFSYKVNNFSFSINIKDNQVCITTNNYISHEIDRNGFPIAINVKLFEPELNYIN